MPTDVPTLSVEDAVAVQKALRGSLGLGPEAFPMPASVGMISDEIDLLRAAGRSDQEIAALIGASLGRPFDLGLIERYYAAPEARRGHT